MSYEQIDGVPTWYEEHGDPDGLPLVARLAVLPATRHTEVMPSADMLRPLVEPFPASRPAGTPRWRTGAPGSGRPGGEPTLYKLP